MERGKWPTLALQVKKRMCRIRYDIFLPSFLPPYFLFSLYYSNTITHTHTHLSLLFIFFTFSIDSFFYSIAFMSPELFMSSETASEFSKSPTIDIFALGATLYCMVVGNPPWMANNQIELANQITNCDLVFPEEAILDPHLKVTSLPLNLSLCPSQSPSLSLLPTFSLISNTCQHFSLPDLSYPVLSCPIL